MREAMSTATTCPEQESQDRFALVYEEHGRHVFRFAYHLLGDADDADDVKQETFLRAFRARHGFRSDSSVRTWLFRICGNICRDRARARLRRPETLYDPVAAPEWLGDHGPASDPHEAAERGELAGLLRRALFGMPAHQREILILREVEEMSCEEIADVLGTTRIGVKLRLHRARGRLKERVQALSAEI